MFQGEPMQQNASFAHNIDLLKKAAKITFFSIQFVLIDNNKQVWEKITDAC